MVNDLWRGPRYAVVPWMVVLALAYGFICRRC